MHVLRSVALVSLLTFPAGCLHHDGNDACAPFVEICSTPALAHSPSHRLARALDSVSSPSTEAPKAPTPSPPVKAAAKAAVATKLKGSLAR